MRRATWQSAGLTLIAREYAGAFPRVGALTFEWLEYGRDAAGRWAILKATAPGLRDLWRVEQARGGAQVVRKL